MTNFRQNRILPIILIAVVAIIAIAILVSIARAIFTPGTSKSAIDVSQTALLSTDSDRSVTMTVRGPIVADENFKSYEVAISPDSRSLTTYNGYNKNVTGGTSLANSIPSYTQFVYALNHAGLVTEKALVGDANDTRGVCATGRLYTFDVMQGDQVVKELWTTSCDSPTGSLTADIDQVKELFTSQIPNAETTIGTETNL